MPAGSRPRPGAIPRSSSRTGHHNAAADLSVGRPPLPNSSPYRQNTPSGSTPCRERCTTPPPAKPCKQSSISTWTRSAPSNRPAASVAISWQNPRPGPPPPQLVRGGPQLPCASQRRTRGGRSAMRGSPPADSGDDPPAGPRTTLPDPIGGPDCVPIDIVILVGRLEEYGHAN